MYSGSWNHWNFENKHDQFRAIPSKPTLQAPAIIFCVCIFILCVYFYVVYIVILCVYNLFCVYNIFCLCIFILYVCDVFCEYISIFSLYNCYYFVWCPLKTSDRSTLTFNVSQLIKY